MKSNACALSYFLIREIFKCFTSKLHYMEENDIINYILDGKPILYLLELKENNLTENLDKTNLDFEVVYMLFDLLEHLGLVTRKLENNQRFLMWTGFAQTRKKYGIIFKVDPSKISRDNIIHMKMSEGKQKKYGTCTEQFIAAFYYQIYTKHAQEDNRVITKDEFEFLKNDILIRDTNLKNVEERQKILEILMQIMVYIGLIEKQGANDKESVEEEKAEKSVTSNYLSKSNPTKLPTLGGKKSEKGYKWIFPHTEVFIDEEYKFEEIEYFDKRKDEFKIEFKKEPPKTTQANLDHQLSGYALLQGK